MTWKTDEALSNNLSWSFYVLLEKLKSGLKISILGNLIRPIDPLFIDEGCEHVESCGSNDYKHFCTLLGNGHLK